MYRSSRIGASVPDPNVNYAAEPFFKSALSGHVFFGPINFPADSLEPRIIIAVPIEAYAGATVGALAAEVNVRYVWDVVQQIHIGQSGYAYVVSSDGILVAHPDLQLVLQHTDLSGLRQVAALRAHDDEPSGTGLYTGLNGRYALVSYRRIPDIGWTVLVERPLIEAYAPVLISLGRTGGILLAVFVLALGAAVRLAGRVVRPIEVLRQGAGRLEAGDLNARLHLETGDEFEQLADDFNRMASRLQEANAGLERKVAERTQALEHSLHEVRALGDTIQSVGSSLDLREVLQTIVVHATKLSGSQAGLVYEFDRTAAAFQFRVGHGVRPGVSPGPPSGLPPGLSTELTGALEAAPPPLHDSLLGRAAAAGAPQNIADAADRACGAPGDLLHNAGYRSILAIPTIRGDQLIGAIVLARTKAGGYSEQEIDVLRTFANGCTIAIDHARLFLEVGQKNAALQLANQHKSQFLANMSHELRTPMNAILGFTELMSEGIYGELDDRLKKPVEQLRINGQYLLRLINDVLDLSRIEAGHLELNLAEYNIDEVLEALRTAAEPLAAAKGLTLHISTDAVVGHSFGDSQRMFQVLLNIVGNAIKFTTAGGVEVGVAATDDEIHYTVEDTGIGIVAEELGTIFDEFGRGDPTVAKRFAGTGLGLAIAKRFVTKHGGRIWAESTPNVGSTFHVIVPRWVC
jgi:signal transduction histidine kinase